jgi:hypothetical protein
MQFILENNFLLFSSFYKKLKQVLIQINLHIEWKEKRYMFKNFTGENNT